MENFPSPISPFFSHVFFLSPRVFYEMPLSGFLANLLGKQQEIYVANTIEESARMKDKIDNSDHTICKV